MSENNGGPAFPNSKRVGENYMDVSGAGRHRTVTVQQGGMSLRDYFAAKAMGAMTDHFYRTRPASEWAEDCANTAYRMADAMLKARE